MEKCKINVCDLNDIRTHYMNDGIDPSLLTYKTSNSLSL